MSGFQPGKIEIAFRRAADRKIVLRVASRRPQAAAVLVGKTPAQALKVLPMLFSVCGQGQRAVAQAAFAAAGWAEAPDRALCDQVLREAVVEHLWRLLLDWPAMVNPNSTNGGDRQARFAAWFKRLRSTEPWAEMREDLQRLLPELLAWAQASEQRAGGEVGAISEASVAECNALSFPAPMDLLLQLRRETGLSEQFCALPVWQGRAVETGSFDQHRQTPMVGDLLLAGQVLAARRVARVLALSRVLDALAAEASAPISVGQSSGVGAMAAIETARGVLVHAVELDNGVVSRYAVLAPTEWNFHPDSLWVTTLQNALDRQPEASDDAIRRTVHHWALTIDPCVPIEITQEFKEED